MLSSSFSPLFLSFSGALSSFTRIPFSFHPIPPVPSLTCEMFLDRGRFIFAFFFFFLLLYHFPLHPAVPHSPALLHFVQTGIQAGWQLPGNRLRAHWLRLCLCFSAWLLHGVNCRYVGGYSYLGLGAGVRLPELGVRRGAISLFSDQTFASLDEVTSGIAAYCLKCRDGRRRCLQHRSPLMWKNHH